MTAGIIQGAILQIVDDVVGFMSWNNVGSRLFIWNWRKGDLLVVSVSTLATIPSTDETQSELSLYSLDDFSFISSRAYVLSGPDPNPSFRVYSFSDCKDGPTLHAVLCLPETKLQSKIALLGIHTAPFTTMAEPPASIRGSRPYTTAPHSRIHVVNLDLVHRHGDEQFTLQSLVVIHNRTFLSYLKETDLFIADWEKWGPKHTYWIPGTTGSRWLRYVHGERLVRLTSYTNEDDHALNQIEIYDFGTLRGPSQLLPEEERDQLESKERAISYLQNVFQEPLRYQLPCRMITRREQRSSLGFMIDEDRLVGIKVTSLS